MKMYHVGKSRFVLGHRQYNVEFSLNCRLVPTGKTSSSISCFKLSNSRIFFLTTWTLNKNK